MQFNIATNTLLFQKVYAESPIGIEIYDEQGLLVDANRACLEIFGISDIVAVTGFRLFDDPNLTDDAKGKIRKGESVRFETTFDFAKVKANNLYMTAKSGIIYLDVLITPLSPGKNGLANGYMVQVQDITSRRRAEDELRKTLDELEHRVAKRTSDLAHTNERLELEVAERRRAEAEISTIYNAISDMITVQDTNYRILNYNRTVESIWGTDLKGRLCYETYQSRKEICPDCAARKALETKRPASTFQAGTSAFPPVEIYAFPIFNEAGEVVAVVEHGRDVTEKLKMETTLRESEAKWRSLVQNSPDIILTTDRRGVIQFINHIPEGLSPEEAVGTTVYDYVPKEHQETVRQAIEGVFRTQKPNSYETLARGANDCLAWYSTRVGPVKNGDNVVFALLITTDITEQKRMEEELLAEHALRKAIEDSLQVGIGAVDMAGRHTYLNPAFYQMMGWSEEELLGTGPPYVYWPPEDVGVIENEFSAILSGKAEKKSLELVCMRKNGEHFNALVIPSPLMNAEGETIGWLGSFYDITERKKLEEKLLEISITDELTGLLNRRGFMTMADRQLKVSERTRDVVFLIFTDVDNLKFINDTLGHKAGDRLIREAAGMIKNTFRESDIIGRVGGDEYAVLLTEQAAREDEALILRRLEENIGMANQSEGREYEISLSTGIVRCEPDRIASIEELLSSADKLMYDKKMKKKHA